jgi:tRNA uridine 5-carboxymethylaminomethyl modification enzyme
MSLTDELQRRAEQLGFGSVSRSVSAASLLQRPGASYAALAQLGLGDRALPPDVAEAVEINLKYEGYLERQSTEVARTRRYEERPLPASLDYDSLKGLRTEARQQLARFRPSTVGQAGRIAGVTPADIAVLLVNVERLPESAASS